MRNSLISPKPSFHTELLPVAALLGLLRPHINIHLLHTVYVFSTFGSGIFSVGVLPEPPYNFVFLSSVIFFSSKNIATSSSCWHFTLPRNILTLHFIKHSLRLPYAVRHWWRQHGFHLSVECYNPHRFHKLNWPATN